MGNDNRFMSRFSSTVFDKQLTSNNLKCDVIQYKPTLEELVVPSESEILRSAKEFAHGKSFTEIIRFAFTKGAEYAIDNVKNMNYGNKRTF